MEVDFATLFSNVGEQVSAAVIVAVAAILAGLIGVEREISSKPAGFRTHMLVGGAAALLVILGKIMVTEFDVTGLESSLRFDPIRIIEAIIVGVSFIGAGTILKVQADERVRYLTTAASILFAAGIGIATALQQFVLAVLIVVVVLIINFLLAKVDSKVK